LNVREVEAGAEFVITRNGQPVARLRRWRQTCSDAATGSRSSPHALPYGTGVADRADAAAQAVDWLELFPCAAASDDAVGTALADAAAGRASY
jgi:antitoxin (DNA-binding transcriptional repressor) of toxin-antitoxin stability system